MNRTAISLHRVFPVTLVRRTSWLAAMGSLVVFWKVQYPGQGLVQDWGSLEPSRMMEKRRQGRCQQVRQLRGSWLLGPGGGRWFSGVGGTVSTQSGTTRKPRLSNSRPAWVASVSVTFSWIGWAISSHKVRRVAFGQHHTVSASLRRPNRCSTVH